MVSDLNFLFARLTKVKLNQIGSLEGELSVNISTLAKYIEDLFVFFLFFFSFCLVYIMRMLVLFGYYRKK